MRQLQQSSRLATAATGCVLFAGLLALIGPNKDTLALPSSGTEGESSLRVLAIRLLPGDDLKTSISGRLKNRHVSAATIITCVGSLQRAHLRQAGQNEGTWLEGPLEIVSLVGTLGADGSHLHISLSNGQGATTGGHLLEGSRIFTTAEVVIGLLPQVSFLRSVDPRTGFKELQISPSDPTAH
jgi:predicted DNA-binding protein with PD1-like motif